jgi:hypothetical protein
MNNHRHNEALSSAYIYHNTIATNGIRSLKTASILFMYRGRRVPDRMIVGFINTCAISAYHH